MCIRDRLLEQQNVPAVKDQIQVFQGKDQFVNHELDNIRKIEKNSEILAISGINDRYWQTMGSSMNEFDLIAEKKCINIRYVGSEPQRESLKQYEAHNFSYRLLPHSFCGDVNIAIFPQAFAMFVFTEPVSSIYVHSPKIAQTYTEFFETLWKMGR